MKVAWRAGVGVVALVVAAGVAARLQMDPAPVRLELEPEQVRACETPTVTRVRWDATALRGEGGVRLEVNNLGRPPKLWVQGGKRGSAEAGKWAHDGYTVTLKALDGRVLARRTLASEPCRR
ncbi:hypothetical protein [Pseudoxanthomonas taiwanensis]|jgi:hypothetical protein|uniref:hypothetical protein n=1 Tax=Pseudoxanthomonas taiwanensis TaxID=176598 RepID=UPI00138990E1|nr:hypothetical protein [Pseudoxanthomonas taiwanensis]